jgi:hypothetical protein
MSNQADAITTTEPLHGLNPPAEGKQSKLAEENAVALSVAENEGFPVVSGNEKSDQTDRFAVIEIAPATNVKPIPITDISEKERKLA